MPTPETLDLRAWIQNEPIRFKQGVLRMFINEPERILTIVDIRNILFTNLSKKDKSYFYGKILYVILSLKQDKVIEEYTLSRSNYTKRYGYRLKIKDH